MRAREIIEALGVPVVEVRGKLPKYPKIGFAPNDTAETMLIDGAPVVWWLADKGPWQKTFIDVLHEVLHVAAGPASLGDEVAVMGAQAELINLLEDPKERAVARADFAQFNFSWTHPRSGMRYNMVTRNVAVFNSEEWNECRLAAEAVGLLAKLRGEWAPVFGGGVHADWDADLRSGFPEEFL